MSLEDQDVEIDESSPSQEPQQQQPDEPAQESAAEQKPAEVEASKPVEQPFHEHPRFREVIEQKNKFAEELRQSQLAAARMQAQLDLLVKQREPQAQENPLYKRLESIDPEFAKYLRGVEEKASSVEQLKKELAEIQEYRQKQAQQEQYSTAVAEVNRLHAENNVPKDMQPFYQARLEQMAAENPNLKFSDLAVAYKQIHGQFTSYLETLQRQKLAGYVQDKTKDAKAPAAQPKGQSVGVKKMEYSKDPGEAKAQLIKNILKQSRSSSDI